MSAPKNPLEGQTVTPGPEATLAKPEATVTSGTVEPTPSNVVTPPPDVIVDLQSEKPVNVPPAENLVSVEQKEEKGGGRGWLWLVVGILVGLVLGGGLGWWMANKKPAATEVTPTPAAQVEETPAPTPEESDELVDRAILKVQVLNGSGKAGVAATAADFLAELGYENVDTGNADADTYTETEIMVKEEFTAFLGTISDDLSGQYQVASEAGELSSDSDYDVVIIIGQE